MVEILVNLVEFSPRFFRPMNAECCSTMHRLASVTTVPTNVRHLALEWLITLAENKPATARKVTLTVVDEATNQPSQVSGSMGWGGMRWDAMRCDGMG